MPRNLKFQRLNRSPKHRWSMLRNMAASLIQHERITTTEAKAKALMPFFNRIFARALINQAEAKGKVAGWVRIKKSIHKIYDELIDVYRPHVGGVVRMVKLQKRKEKDCSEMAIVELIHK